MKPIKYKINEQDVDVFYLRGIVSSVFDNAEKNFPTVYTKFDYYLDFTESILENPLK